MAFVNSPDDMPRLTSAKLVIAGGFGVGKTTMVGAVSEIPPVNTEAWMTQAGKSVDPLGKTVARIPPYSEGTASAQVRLLNYRSPYSHWVGDRPWWGLLAVCVGVVVVRRWRG